MKLNRSTNWIRIALLCLALALVVIVLTIPLLAKGISQIVGNPIGPEKLDIRPIPVPVPPEPLAINDPPVSETSSSSLASGSIPQPILVPTPPVSAVQITTASTEPQMPESSTRLAVQIVNSQEVIAISLMFIVLLSWIWLHRVPGFHSLNRKNA